MTAPEDAVQAALDEREVVDRAVRRGPRRVRAAGVQIMARKAVRAWFVVHRKSLLPYMPAELKAADGLYQELLQAAGRGSAKATYLAVLGEIKSELLRLQPLALVAATGTVISAAAERAPDFGVLTADLRMRALLSRRWEECEACLRGGAPLAAAVMMGGIMEGVLLARIEQTPDKSAVFSAKATPRNRAGQSLPLRDWKLQAFLAVARELGWISPVAGGTAAVVQDYRNLVHPAREHEVGPAPTVEDAGILWEITKRIVRQVLGA